MVGWFVQEQQIRLLQEQLGKAQPRQFAAGKQPGGLVILLFGKPQAGKHTLNGRLPGVAIRLFKGVVQAGVGFPHAFELDFAGFGHVVFQGPQLFFHGKHRLKHLLHFFKYGAVTLRLILLLHVTYAHSLHQGNTAAVSVFPARQDVEQRGFSAAVYPHQAHPLVILQGQAHILEHHVTAEGFMEVLYR